MRPHAINSPSFLVNLLLISFLILEKEVLHKKGCIESFDSLISIYELWLKGFNSSSGNKYSLYKMKIQSVNI